MRFIAKTLYGLEKTLSQELKNLGAGNVLPANRAVQFEGDMNMLYRINYCIRTALSILMPVAEFRIRTKEDLYKKALKINWEEYLDTERTFSIAPVINSEIFTHSGYAGLVLKDSLADYFRAKTGRRPSVSQDNPDLHINLHISNENVTVSLDSSGIPLFKRGYRKEQSVAPMNEVLAAGILSLSGWDAKASLTDPMCGSGTFPVEAAMIACNIPAGRFREFFGFQRWTNFDEELFEKVKLECNAKSVTSPVKITGSDISVKAVEIARANVAKAGLLKVIDLQVSDFKDLKSTEPEGFLFINPPYGERIKPEAIDELYSMIGSALKHNFPDTTAWLISSNKEAIKHLGLKPAERHILFNGALECTLLKYMMYSGSKKLKKA